MLQLWFSLRALESTGALEFNNIGRSSEQLWTSHMESRSPAGSRVAENIRCELL